MEVMSGYKRTEVGVIPDDWNVKPLSSISEKIMVGIASAATHAYRDKGVALLRNQNIKAGYLDDSDVLYVDLDYEAAFKNKRLKFGDLLTARTGYPGTTCVVPKKYDSAQSFTTLVTRPNREIIDSLFLCYYINSENGQSFFEQSQIGGAQKNVNAGSLQKMPIPVLPLSEQRAIAAALSDVDVLVAKLDQLIAKKRDIKQAAMQQLLTGQTRLPGFGANMKYKRTDVGNIPEDWEIASFSRVTDLITCGIAATPKYVPENIGYPFLSSSNVKNGRVIWEDFKHIDAELHYQLYRNNPPKRGDILYSRVGTIGEAAVVEVDFEFSVYVSLTLIKPKKSLDSYFLMHLLNSLPYKQRAKDQVYLGGGVGNLNVDVVRRYPIVIPSINEQTAIATILSDMDAEIAALKARRDKTRALKQGMMQELLTGRIRLI